MKPWRWSGSAVRIGKARFYVLLMHGGEDRNGALFAARDKSATVATASGRPMELPPMSHISPGILFVLGPICAAVAILLIIEATLVRPANRADGLSGAGDRAAQRPATAPMEWSSPPHLIYTGFRPKSVDGAGPSQHC